MWICSYYHRALTFGCWFWFSYHRAWVSKSKFDVCVEFEWHTDWWKWWHLLSWVNGCSWLLCSALWLNKKLVASQVLEALRLNQQVEDGLDVDEFYSVSTMSREKMLRLKTVTAMPSGYLLPVVFALSRNSCYHMSSFTAIACVCHTMSILVSIPVWSSLVACYVISMYTVLTKSLLCVVDGSAFLHLCPVVHRSSNYSAKGKKKWCSCIEWKSSFRRWLALIFYESLTFKVEIGLCHTRWCLNVGGTVIRILWYSLKWFIASRVWTWDYTTLASFILCICSVSNSILCTFVCTAVAVLLWVLYNFFFFFFCFALDQWLWCWWLT